MLVKRNLFSCVILTFCLFIDANTTQISDALNTFTAKSGTRSILLILATLLVAGYTVSCLADITTVKQM